MKNTLFTLLILTSVIGYSQIPEKFSEINLDSIFNGKSGTFVVYEPGSEKLQIYNPAIAKQKFAVHSTSKIVWSIVALEEGLIENENTLIKWDSTKYPIQKWWPETYKQDQTIVSALRYSVNWYYTELFERTTPEMIEKYLNNLNYQNGFNVEKVHYFGLTYNIRKSAIEQIEFLKDLHDNTYNLSDKTLSAIKKGMTIEKSDNYSLYYKTGLGPTKNDNGIGWVVGYVEKDDKTYFFAFNVVVTDEGEALKIRTEYSKKSLKALELIK